MKWSYKTVHFELKKEGLLGGSFLDEAEIEEQLNDFGRSGWELISVIEVQHGIICFFKQPIDIESSAFVPEPDNVQDDAVAYDDSQEFVEAEPDQKYEQRVDQYEEPDDNYETVNQYDEVEERYQADDNYEQETQPEEPTDQYEPVDDYDDEHIEDDTSSYEEGESYEYVEENEDVPEDNEEDSGSRGIGAIRIE